MTTLVIHAPYSKGKPGAPNSFETYLKTGVGKGYAIWNKWAVEIRPGGTVVLLRKDKSNKRAEGILVRLVETNQYVNGVQRYDVHIRDMKEVPFKKENFNYYGVAVIGNWLTNKPT